MAWSCGIVGLPNAGKSTLFKALTALNVTIENYPFSTIDPNKAIVELPDQRLLDLSELSKPKKITAATIEVIDVAGLVKGASQGEGLGNQFLGHLRDVDLLIHVVAGFDLKAADQKELLSRIDTVNLELCLADLDMVARRKQKVEPKLKSGDKTAHQELAALNRMEKHLNEGKFLKNLEVSGAAKNLTGELALLTFKEMVYVYNVNENQLLNLNPDFLPVSEPVVPLCANLEAELIDLSSDDQKILLDAYGLNESKSKVLLNECYNHLGLSTFYTIKGEEAKAWVVPSGLPADKAAGKIHSDIERGFIKVEVIAWDLLIKEGGLGQAREKGLVRVEGRDYRVTDGDVLFFKFRQ